jgi:diaminohydroxyphosphoribosylaminopyrimidine deaminase/5-amino-6-(5-phosphoribosylamino)uracil reductase
MTTDEWYWMRKAVDLGKNSQAKPGKKAAPRVGVVITRDGKELSSGWRGQLKPDAHAEYCVLEGALKGQNLRGATVYSTLEPCSKRNPEKIPCARRLIDRGVKEVVIGMYDPNPTIYREGWRMLRESAITLRDFSAELRAEIRADNWEFLDQFRCCHGEQGKARFDYTRNDGNYDLKSAGAEIRTHWTPAGVGSIWAYGCEERGVALARHAREFEDIDDPSAFEFSSGGIGVADGQIVVFRSAGHYALVKINHVWVGNGEDRPHELLFEYELRSSASRAGEYRHSRIDELPD